jgi:TonB-dependent receptor
MKDYVCIAVAALGGGFCATAAQAQQAPAQAPATAPAAAPASTAVGEVVVTGHALAEERAAKLKRASRLISDNVSSDELGSLPDFGLGQALKRVPGVSMVINNGRGEEQYMILRGLSPDYNTVTIDGIALPSTEQGSTSAATSTASGRTVGLDVVPSSVAKSVNVFKSWEADLPSDAIGGVTNLQTRSAFDAPGLFVAGKINYAYWEDQRRWHDNTPSGQGELTVSDRFGSNKELGVLLSGTYYRRDSSSLDSVSNGTQGFYAYSGGTATVPATTLTPETNVKSLGLINVPGQTGWLTYDDVRTRQSLFGKLEYKGGDVLKLHLTGGYFEHTLNEDRNNQYFDTVGNPTITSPTTGSFAAGSASVGYDHYLLDRQLKYGEFGASLNLPHDLHVDFTANLADGVYDQKSVDDSFSYNGRSQALAFTYVTSTTELAHFTPLAEANYISPQDYNLAYHQFAENHTNVQVPTLKLDGRWNDDRSSTGPGLRAGLQWRDLVATGWTNQLRYDAPAGLNLGQIGGSFDVAPYNGWGQQILMANPADTAAYFNQNPGLFTLDATNASTSTIGNYRLEENVFSTYAVADYRGDRYSVSVGLRWEDTAQDIRNYLPSAFVSSAKATTFALNDSKSDYAKLLPSLNASWDVTTSFKLRVGASKTLARPDYSQLAQNSSLTVSTVATNSVTGIASQSISNPSLRPRESDNLDLSAEWYPTRAVAFSAAVFHKRISNEIVTLNNIQSGVAEPGQAGVYTVTTTQAQNVGTADAQGLELGLVMPSFSFVHGPLGWFGLVANTTFADYNASDIRMSDGTFRHLPGLISSAKTLANVSLLFNHDAWDGRLAYNHTGKMPYSFSTTNSALDQWYGASDVLDFQMRYHLNRHIAFVFQAQNLTDNTPVRLTGPNINIYSETLQNGRSFFMGADFVF